VSAASAFLKELKNILAVSNVLENGCSSQIILALNHIPEIVLGEKSHTAYPSDCWYP
jgi:hypothetical protein